MGSLAVGIHQIEEGKRNIFWVMSQDFGADGTGLFRTFRLGRARPQVTKHSDPPLSHDFLRDLMHGAEHTANPARYGWIRDRAVSDGKVRFFREAETVHIQEDVVHPSGIAASIGCLNQGADDVPDLRPAFVSRLAQRFRMLLSQDWPRRVVVDLAELRTPPQEQLKAVYQEELEDHPQSGRPRLNWADWRH